MRIKSTGEYPPNWKEIATQVKDAAGWQCVRCGHPHDPKAGFCLTVHHLDMNPANNVWYNCAALCQRCHLTIQAKVNPHQPYMFEHSEWFKPYVCGFYAKKYLKQEISRDEAMERMDELLKLELQ